MATKRRHNRRKTRKGGMTGIEIGIAVALVAGIAGAAYLNRPSATQTDESYDDALRTS